MIQQAGDGWRVSHDPSRGEFCVLVGGERWAFELTEPEWRDLVDLVATLEQQLSLIHISEPTRRS